MKRKLDGITLASEPASAKKQKVTKPVSTCLTTHQGKRRKQKRKPVKLPSQDSSAGTCHMGVDVHKSGQITSTCESVGLVKKTLHGAGGKENNKVNLKSSEHSKKHKQKRKRKKKSNIQDSVKSNASCDKTCVLKSGKNSKGGDKVVTALGQNIEGTVKNKISRNTAEISAKHKFKKKFKKRKSKFDGVKGKVQKKAVVVNNEEEVKSDSNKQKISARPHAPQDFSANWKQLMGVSDSDRIAKQV